MVNISILPTRIGVHGAVHVTPSEAATFVGHLIANGEGDSFVDVILRQRNRKRGIVLRTEFRRKPISLLRLFHAMS